MVAKSYSGQYFPWPCSTTVRFFVKQVQQAGIHITDLRFSTGLCLQHYIQARTLPDLSMLRVLRVEVDHVHLWLTSNGIPPPESILAGAMSLKDDALNLTRTSLQVEGQRPAHLRYYASLSQQLFQMLLMHTKLRCVSFMGGWVFNSESLVDFINAHATTVRSLLFERPSLNSEDLMHGYQSFKRLQQPRRAPWSIYT
jgi:hypothetical protein